MRWFNSNKSDGMDRSPGEKLNLPAIDSRNIASLTTLDGPHSVFLLTFNNGEQMVLKMEAKVTGQSKAVHDLGVRIMGMVSPVKAQALSDIELLHLDRLDSGISRDFFTAEQEVRAGKGGWVKAAFQKGLSGFANSNAYKTKDDKGNIIDDPLIKADLKAKAATLKKDLKGNVKAWKSLGEIVAADLLIGNTDRFDVDRGMALNMGNIQFKKSGKKITEAVGLDSWDPNSEVSDLLTGMDKNDDWKNEFGKYLKTPSSTKDKFNDIITSLNKRLATDFGEQAGFGSKEMTAFHDGYVAGCGKLKKKMAEFAKRTMSAKTGATIPKELMMRLNYLDWL